MIQGQAIVVQASLAEKNRLAAAGASAADIKTLGNMSASHISASMAPPQEPQGMKLYVGGLHFSITSDQLEALFAPFGDLTKVDLHMDTATGTSKGFGFVHFRHAEDGKRCIDQMDGFELAGKPIKVTVSNHGPGAYLSAAPAGMGLSCAGFASAQQQMLLGSIGGMAGSMAQAMQSGPQNGGEVISQLDSLSESSDGRSELGPVSATQRANLMTKLAKNAGMDVPDELRKAAHMPSETGGAARCVVLKNMFDRLSDDAQNKPKYFDELANDVRGECGKLGVVLHVACDKWSNGFVYVKMMNEADATRLRDVMHGRYFAQNKILAEMIPEDKYNKKFKLPF